MKNVGSKERYGRIGLGVAAGLASFYVKNKWAKRALRAAAISGIETGVTRYCPMNQLLGIDNADHSNEKALALADPT